MNRIELLDVIFSDPKIKIGVEIGTFKGEFSKEILKRFSGTLYMVDVWNELGEEYIDASNHKNFENGVYGECMSNIKGLEERGLMVRGTSKKTSEIFHDSSLDFIYIDANHSYDFVKEDLELWYPKVKPGGWVMGHDYLKLDWEQPPFADNHKDKHIWMFDDSNPTEQIYAGLFGVNPAVDEFCKKNNYEPNFTEEWLGTWYFKKQL